MKRWSIICLAVGLLCLNAQGQAQLPAPLDSLIIRGTDAALRHAYAEAERCFREAAEVSPDQPAGVVFLAGLLHQRAEDLGEAFDRRRFDSLLTQAEVRARLNKATAPNDLWVPLLRATARGMLAVAEAESGEWMAAVRDALSSSSSAEDVWESDSSQADAGLPLGNYLYWRSRKTEALHWLPLFSDDRSEGIRRLELCARNGRYHSYAAISSLIWILHDARDFEKAEAWARIGLRAYPENRNFLAGLAMVDETQGHFLHAADVWGRIVQSLQTVGAGSSYSTFSASVNHVRCLLSAGEGTTARIFSEGVMLPSAAAVPSTLARRYVAKQREWTVLKQRLHALFQASAQ